MRSMSAPIRRSRPEFLSRNRDPVYVLGGLLYILGGILLVIYMFISGGSVMSEEDDIIGRAVERAGSQIHEWLPPPSINTTTAKLESADKLLAMHRFIITLRVEEAGDHHAMEEQLRALAAADYSTCPCPVDVEVLVPTPRDATEREAYRPILAMLHHYRWKRGRFAIRALPPHMDVDELSRLWQPQSEWEMWVLLEKDAIVSSEWMKWLAAAINTYVLATPSATAGLPPVVDAAAAPKTGGDGWSTRTLDEWRVTTPRPSAAPQAMMGISLHRPLTVMPLSADARRHHPTGIDLLAESIRNDPFLLQQPGHYGMVWLPASWTTYQEWLMAHGTPTAEAGSTLSSSMWTSLSTFMFGTQRYVLFPNFCAHLVQRVDAADEKKSSQQGNALELPEASQLKAYNADVVEVMRTH